MHRMLLLALVALCLSLPTTLVAADWSQFLGPTANGMAPDTGINKAWTDKPPQVLWKVSLGDKGFAGPAIANGTVFIIDHNADKDIVRALDLKTGADSWQYTYQDSAKTNSGWGYATSTPTIQQGKVYTMSRFGVLNCLDEKTGNLVWTRNVVADFKGRVPSWNLATSPFIDKEKLIVCPGGADAAVVALDKNTGKTIWQGGGSDVPGYATPVAATINGKKQYVIYTTENVMGVDANSGERLWAYPWKTGSNVNAATPIVIGNSVFITSAYGHGSAFLDITNAGVTPRWEKRDIQSRFTTPLLLNGHLYTTTDKNSLICFEVATGEIKWKQQGFEWGGLVGLDGVMIVVDGRTGDVVMVKMSPDSYQELGRIKPLGGRSWTAPIVADGKLLVRNQQEMVCLDLQ